MRIFTLATVVLVSTLYAPLAFSQKLPKKELQSLAGDWIKERPRTRFESWDLSKRKELLTRAAALGEVPDGQVDKVVSILWDAMRKNGPKFRDEVETPYGKAKWISKGKGGKKSPFMIGLHGGGEGAGSASSAAGSWPLTTGLAFYPQAIELVHDAWNTVEGEKFLLTLIDIAKLTYDVDPDRIYSVGFSMGGTGTWFMAGRHPDLFGGAIPAHGVIMASPKAQLATKEEVISLQHGLLPNVRNLPVYFYTGEVDMNCRPGTFLYAWDRIEELKRDDPEGYDVRFQIHPRLAHAFAKGEPKTGLQWIYDKSRNAFPETLVWEYSSSPFPEPSSDAKTERFTKHWYYWLRCSEPMDNMRIRAAKKGNEFDIDTANIDASKLSVYVHPSMIDVSHEVVVRVNGKEVYRGIPSSSYEVLLDSLDARLDRRMVFDRCIPLGAR